MMRGSLSVCSSDVAAYSSLVARWKSQRSLKSWFQGLSDHDRIAWYRKQQNHTAGKKRTFEDMQYTEQDKQSIVSSSLDQDCWVPFGIFARNKFLEGVDRNRAGAEFRALVQSGQGRFRRGQWHVLDYQGFKEESGSVKEGAVITSRSASVQDHEQLVDLQCGGASLLKSYRQNLETSSSSALVAVPADVPITFQNQAQEFGVQPIFNPMPTAMANEAVGRSSGQGIHLDSLWPES